MAIVICLPALLMRMMFELPSKSFHLDEMRRFDCRHFKKAESLIDV